MEREYCPWCYHPFAFDPQTVTSYPHRVECAMCHGEIVVVMRPRFFVGCGTRLPLELINQVPRV